MDNRKWKDMPNRARLEMEQIHQSTKRFVTLYQDLDKMITSYRNNEMTMTEFGTKFIAIQVQIDNLMGYK